MKFVTFLTTLLFASACAYKEYGGNNNHVPSAGLVKTIEAITLFGDTLRSPELRMSQALTNYESAKKQYKANQDDPDALVWYGRRTGYLGYFQQAINIYTDGIQKHPTHATMYRHRGHRYLSTRQYDKAIADFEKAVTLIRDQPDQIEADGLPNARNIPLTTLHGNIWYHLGLAYYLKNDMANALRAFSNRVVIQKFDDNIVSGGHWLYMILSRLGRNEEATAVLKDVHRNMDIIENSSYHSMCLFYQGELTSEDLKPEGISSSSDDVLAYGLGNWYLYQSQDSLKAKSYYRPLLDEGNKFSFAYLSAEADWMRLFGDI